MQSSLATEAYAKSDFSSSFLLNFGFSDRCVGQLYVVGAGSGHDTLTSSRISTALSF